MRPTAYVTCTSLARTARVCLGQPTPVAPTSVAADAALLSPAAPQIGAAARARRSTEEARTRVEA